MNIDRTIRNHCNDILDSGKSILLLGPRQVGKTTYLMQLPHDLYISLIDPESLWKYSQSPEQLKYEVLAINTKKIPLIIIDEIQKIPHLTDTIQLLIDQKKAQFVLCGSSVRKIRNLLPGRVIQVQMDPITILECPENYSLEDRLLWGTLPEIVTRLATQKTLCAQLLRSYITTYLDEEIRKEALIRQITPFIQFLKLAAIESGNLINFSKLASQIGISHPTIAEYYRILETCMVIHRFDAFSQSRTRKRLVTGSKNIFFDLGIRRLAAEEGENPPETQKGFLFEQWVGLELKRLINHHQNQAQVLFWRDHNGPEVDWIVRTQDKLIPIEVKWTKLPNEKDAKHLRLFLNEYPTQAKKGFIICKTDRPKAITETITALPWQDLDQVFLK